jgi:hypothetical protein
VVLTIAIFTFEETDFISFCQKVYIKKIAKPDGEGHPAGWPGWTNPGRTILEAIPFCRD